MLSQSDSQQPSRESNDIVTRLRQLREVLMGNPIMAREVQEAIDEIERLRADNKELLEIAKNFADEGKCYAYEDRWGMCVCPDCKWHRAERAWESYCMRRGQ